MQEKIDDRGDGRKERCHVTFVKDAANEVADSRKRTPEIEMSAQSRREKENQNILVVAEDGVGSGTSGKRCYASGNCSTNSLE